MISKLTRGFAAFSIATVLTQMILLGYFLTRGTVNGTTLTQVVALMNGIDISGNRLRKIIRDGEDREQPDFNEILDARKMASLDMDMRLRSQDQLRDELSADIAKHRIDMERFDERRLSFDRRLDELKKVAEEKGLQEAQRILQSLDAAQAKDQLLMMVDDDRMDDVVNIIKAMSGEKRKDILAEFISREESEILAEILKRIGEGIPTTTLIDQAHSGS